MIVPLTRHLSFVEGPNKARYPYCNCLYINDERRAVIDSSCGREDLGFLVDKRIDAVINSHFHEDHILNNRFFPEAEIWAHPLDAPAIRSREVFFDYYGFQDQEEREKAARHLDSIQLQPTPVHRELREPEVLDFGTVSLSVVFTPGHTPGHCCFYEEREGILFSADIDLSGFGPWYGHGCSNLDDFIKSIEKCIALEPRMVVTSHNGIIQEDLLARFRSYLDVIYYKEDLVRNALKKRPSTLEELAGKRIFYGDGIDKDPLLSIFERMAIERHLVRLMGLKEVKREGEMYCRS